MRIAWRITLLLAFCFSAHGEISHFYRIDANVYRGTQPKKADFAELKRMGIKTVLDLRGGPIHKPHERKLVEAAGMQYVSIRLSGIWEPHYSQMARILKLLEDTARGPVFFHCHRGDDRVGLVMACYRIVHDHWTNQRALHEARQRGLNPLELLMKRYIRNFDPSKLQ